MTRHLSATELARHGLANAGRPRLCPICSWPPRERQALHDALYSAGSADADGIPDFEAICSAHAVGPQVLASHLAICLGEGAVTLAAERRRSLRLADLAQKLTDGAMASLAAAGRVLQEVEDAAEGKPTLGLARGWTDLARVQTLFLTGLVAAMRDSETRARMSYIEGRLAAAAPSPEDPSGSFIAERSTDAAARFAEAVAKRRGSLDRGPVLDVEPEPAQSSLDEDDLLA